MVQSIPIESLQMKVSFKKTVTTAVLVGVSSVSFAFGTGNMPVVPSGWMLKENYGNVLVYQKNGEQTYMQVVDIKSGAKVRFIHPGKQYGNWGSYPKFTVYDLNTLWNNAVSPVTMVNGQFFNWSITPSGQLSPTTLSFAIKSAGTLLTYGEDKNAYPASQMKQIEFFDNMGAFTTSWSEYRLNRASSAQNIIVGLDPSVDKNKGAKQGRMYMCTIGPSSPSPWLLILSAISLRQISTDKLSADQYLIDWKCNPGSVIMHDGSGSAQFRTAGGIDTSSYFQRKLPQAISVSNN